MVAADEVTGGALVREPALEHLASEWRTLLELCAELDPDDWLLPTNCPGWSVHDNVAHVATFERMLQGHPPPGPVPSVENDAGSVRPDHVKNAVGASNEVWVSSWRDRPSIELLAELRGVTGERLVELGALPTERWDEATSAPSGQRLPFREFIELRTFDCWAHEQDIRRAVGRPGHWSGAVPWLAIDRVATAMGYVVGKKAGAPQGSSVVFQLREQAERDVAVGVGDRASLLAEVPSDPTTVLALTAECFVCLGCGRWDPASVLATGGVEITGDSDLGRRVVEAMPFMI